MQEVGGVEDGPLVVFEDGQPVGDIGSVILAGRKSQLQIGTQEVRTQLGDELFFSITRRCDANKLGSNLCCVPVATC